MVPQCWQKGKKKTRGRTPNVHDKQVSNSYIFFCFFYSPTHKCHPLQLGWAALLPLAVRLLVTTLVNFSGLFWKLTTINKMIITHSIKQTTDRKAKQLIAGCVTDHKKNSCKWIMNAIASKEKNITTCTTQITDLSWDIPTSTAGLWQNTQFDKCMLHLNCSLTEWKDQNVFPWTRKKKMKKTRIFFSEQYCQEKHFVIARNMVKICEARNYT